MSFLGNNQDKPEDLTEFEEEGDHFLDDAALRNAAGTGRGASLRRVLPLVALLLVAGGGAGAYFYFAGATATPSYTPPAEITDADTGAQPVDLASSDLSPSGETADLGDAPAMPQPENADATAEQQGFTDPQAPQPAPDAMADATTGVLGDEQGLAQPPAAEVDPFAPFPGETQGAAPTAPATTADPALNVVPPVTAADAAMPPADLPMPEMAPAAPVPAPSAAESAIVQNAPALNSLSGATTPAETAAAAAAAAATATATAGGQAAPAPGQAMPPLNDVANAVNSLGVMRPLPGDYLTVRKDRSGDDFDTLLKVARSMLKQGQYASALQMFNSLLVDAPKDSRLLMGRALSLQNMGQKDAAIEAYEEVLRESPKSLEGLVNLLGLLKSKDPAMAVEKLTELRAAYPYDADILAQLSISYGALKSYPEALMYIEMAEALKPDNAMFTYNKAVILDKMGQTAKAAMLYRQLIRLAAEDKNLPYRLPVEAMQKRLSRLK